MGWGGRGRRRWLRLHAGGFWGHSSALYYPRLHQCPLQPRTEPQLRKTCWGLGVLQPAPWTLSVHLPTPPDGGRGGEAAFLICSVFATCQALHKPSHPFFFSPQPHGRDAVLPHLTRRTRRQRERQLVGDGPGLELGAARAWWEGSGSFQQGAAVGTRVFASKNEIREASLPE